MKNLRFSGLAVILAATLLLAACASHEAHVADTTLMSGPDTTMAQPDGQNERLERLENALVIQQAWLDNHEMLMDYRETNLDRQENELAIQQAWLDEREMQMDHRETNLDRQENELAIQQAWLDEREMQVNHRESNLERQENEVAIQQAWLDEREMQFALSESVATGPTQLASPALTRVEGGRCYASVVIPAKYKSVAVTKPVELPKGESSMPVLYQTVTEQVKVTEESMGWKEILCETTVTPGMVSEIQQALAGAGFNPGPIDGIIGQQTLAAVNAFQKEHNLTVASHLTIETVNTLGVDF